jgi:hypothetical protein
MEIETLVEELDQIVGYKGAGGLIEAVVRAPKLLGQTRYRRSDDPRALLVRDITNVIACLPEPIQEHANGILPINLPDEYIIGRLRKLGLGEASSTAKHWHRIAVLSRVAFGLAALAGDRNPSYRILRAHFQVRQVRGPSLPTLPSGRSMRIIEIDWLIESNVSDLGWFHFDLPTEPYLKLTQLRVAGHPCVRTIHVGEKWHNHHFALNLSPGLPTGLPISLKVDIEYNRNKRAPAQVQFTPGEPIGELAFSYTRLYSKHKCRFVEWVANNEFERIEGETIRTELEEVDGLRPVEETDHFTLREPKVGRTYQFSWSGDEI